MTFSSRPEYEQFFGNEVLDATASMSLRLKRSSKQEICGRKFALVRESLPTLLGLRMGRPMSIPYEFYRVNLETMEHECDLLKRCNLLTDEWKVFIEAARDPELAQAVGGSIDYPHRLKLYNLKTVKVTGDDHYKRYRVGFARVRYEMALPHVGSKDSREFREQDDMDLSTHIEDEHNQVRPIGGFAFNRGWVGSLEEDRFGCLPYTKQRLFLRCDFVY